MGAVSRRQAMVAGAGLATWAGAGAASAQPPLPAGGAAGAPAGADDPLLASCLLIAGRRQIEVCRMALDRLQSEDVKAFAKAEIEEHEGMKKKLAGLGFRYPVAPLPGTGAVDPATGTPAPPAPGRGGVVDLPLPAGAARIFGVDHEVVDQCLATMKSEMGKLEGVKLEKCFVGDQLHKHYGLFDHGVVFRRHASPAMAAILDDARKVIEQHIATCKALMDRLDGAKASGT